MQDLLRIESLELEARIGVPDEERATPQRLTLSATLEPSSSFHSLDDRIERAVDYAAACQIARRVAGSGERRLLETLAQEIAAELLASFPLASVELELRKYPLPDAAFVAARIRRP